MTLSANETEIAFSKLYAEKWIESSGTGSTVEATREVVAYIASTIESLGVKSILDAGCGDGLWMPDFEGVSYVGVDIAREALDRATMRHPDREYRLMDITRPNAKLPECTLAICRDVLMHLPLMAALHALDNIRNSGARWLLATTYPASRNKNIAAGEFYRINMAADPFNLGEPLTTAVNGNGKGNDVKKYKLIGLWQLR